MDDRITKLKMVYQNLFGEEVYSQSYIEVTDGDEIVLNANKEGLLVLLEQIMTLCESEQPGLHCHVDEAGMANKCDKPLVIQLIEAPRQK